MKRRMLLQVGSCQVSAECQETEVLRDMWRRYHIVKLSNIMMNINVYQLLIGYEALHDCYQFSAPTLFSLLMNSIQYTLHRPFETDRQII